VRLVAESFAWPFRGRWRATWVRGVLVTLLLPVLFIPLLGYAIAATRAAEADPSVGPPPWRITPRLLEDGAWTSLAVLLTVVPFAIVEGALAAALTGLLRDALYAHVAAILLLALPWGLVVLVHMPHATSSFAASRRPADLFDIGKSWRGVRRDFAIWNVVAAAMVTGWAIGLACAGLLCLGLVPGIFYAILVSAHAVATLHGPGTHPPAG